MSKHKPANRVRFALWIDPEIMEVVNDSWEDDDCFTKSEYIEKAIRFYSSYNSATDSTKFLQKSLTSGLRNTLKSFADGQNKLLFKIAVELSVLSNVIAATNQIDDIKLQRLRGECVKEVQSTNGMVDFDLARKWQGD